MQTYTTSYLVRTVLRVPHQQAKAVLGQSGIQPVRSLIGHRGRVFQQWGQDALEYCVRWRKQRDQDVALTRLVRAEKRKAKNNAARRRTGGRVEYRKIDVPTVATEALQNQLAAIKAQVDALRQDVTLLLERSRPSILPGGWMPQTLPVIAQVMKDAQAMPTVDD